MTLWSVGRYDLGLEDRDFRRLTFREFNALCNRRQKQEEAETYRAAFIVSSIYNVNRAKGQEPIRPEDFMGKKKERKQSPEQMLEFVKAMQASIDAKKQKG